MVLVLPEIEYAFIDLENPLEILAAQRGEESNGLWIY
jgi:hypothetical protein